MQHSIAYLAGVGAKALGMLACESPINCTDYAPYGDFLDGFHAFERPASTNDDGETIEQVTEERDGLTEDVEKAAKLLAAALNADDDCDIVDLAEMAAEKIGAHADGKPALAVVKG